MLKNKNTGIILLHGAGLGSFTWNELVPLLEYPVLTVDFLNRGKGDKANAGLTFDDYVQAAIHQIKQWDKDHFIIVAHSIGGCIGLRLADYFKEKTMGFAGISAAIPRNGNSFVSCLPLAQRILMPVILKLAGTKPPKKMIEKMLCNGLAPRQTAMVVQKFTPESRLLYTQKTHAEIPRVPAMYVQFAGDKSFSMAMQQRMAGNLKAQRIEKMDGGHLAMMSYPQKLAEILNGFLKELNKGES